MKKYAAMVALAAVGSAVAFVEPPKGEGQTVPTKAVPTHTEMGAKFEKMKKLAGVWQSGDEDKNGEPDQTVIYRVVSGGSALAEFLMPGTDHEMVTMYHMDGESIVATHYCSLGNQPRMRSKSGGGDNTLMLDFIDGTNMASKDEMHIHSLTMTFVDADHVNADWKAYAGGKDAGHSPSFKFTRVKDAEAATKITNATMSCCVPGGGKTASK